MAFFIPFTCIALSQFYSITSPVLFTKNNKIWNEKKEDFLYIATSGYHVISKEMENRVFRHHLRSHILSTSKNFVFSNFTQKNIFAPDGAFPPMSTALFLKDFAKFKRRHQCWSFSGNFIKRLQHKCFPVNFASLLGTFFVQNTSIQVLLNFSKMGLHQEYFPVNLHQNTYEQLLLHFL